MKTTTPAPPALAGADRPRTRHQEREKPKSILIRDKVSLASTDVDVTLASGAARRKESVYKARRRSDMGGFSSLYETKVGTKKETYRCSDPQPLLRDPQRTQQEQRALYLSLQEQRALYLSFNQPELRGPSAQPSPVGQENCGDQLQIDMKPDENESDPRQNSTTLLSPPLGEQPSQAFEQSTSTTSSEHERSTEVVDQACVFAKKEARHYLDIEGDCLSDSKDTSEEGSDSSEFVDAIRAGQDEASRCNALIGSDGHIVNPQMRRKKENVASRSDAEEEKQQLSLLKRRGAFILIGFLSIVVAATVLSGTLSRRLGNTVKPSPSSLDASVDAAMARLPLAPSLAPTQRPTTTSCGKNVFNIPQRPTTTSYRKNIFNRSPIPIVNRFPSGTRERRKLLIANGANLESEAE